LRNFIVTLLYGVGDQLNSPRENFKIFFCKDICHNNKPLAIHCHVVYATKLRYGLHNGAKNSIKKFSSFMPAFLTRNELYNQI